MNPHVQIKKIKAKYACNPEATQALEESYRIFTEFNQQLLGRLHPAKISKVVALKNYADSLVKAYTFIQAHPSTTPLELEEAKTIIDGHIRNIERYMVNHDEVQD